MIITHEVKFAFDAVGSALCAPGQQQQGGGAFAPSAIAASRWPLAAMATMTAEKAPASLFQRQDKDDSNGSACWWVVGRQARRVLVMADCRILLSSKNIFVGERGADSEKML